MDKQVAAGVQRKSKAMAVYDGIGNEIFDDLAKKLAQDPTVQAFIQDGARSFAFDDGSTISFKDGFAHVAEASTPAEVGLESRFFICGALMVASIMALFQPRATCRAIVGVVSKRLEKEGHTL